MGNNHLLTQGGPNRTLLGFYSTRGKRESKWAAGGFPVVEQKVVGYDRKVYRTTRSTGWHVHVTKERADIVEPGTSPSDCQMTLATSRGNGDSKGGGW